jgi:hypothetical protein
VILKGEFDGATARAVLETPDNPISITNAVLRAVLRLL